MPDDDEHRAGAPALRPRARCARRHQDRDDPRLLPIAAAALPARGRRRAAFRGDRRAQRRRGAGGRARDRARRARASACDIAAGRKRWPSRALRTHEETLYRAACRACARSARGCARRWRTAATRFARMLCRLLDVARGETPRRHGRRGLRRQALATSEGLLRRCDRATLTGKAGERPEVGRLIADWLAAGVAARDLDEYAASLSHRTRARARGDADHASRRGRRASAASLVLKPRRSGRRRSGSDARRAQIYAATAAIARLGAAMLDAYERYKRLPRAARLRRSDPEDARPAAPAGRRALGAVQARRRPRPHPDRRGAGHQSRAVGDRRRARRGVLRRRGRARASAHGLRGRRRQAVDLQLPARRSARPSLACASISRRASTAAQRALARGRRSTSRSAPPTPVLAAVDAVFRARRRHDGVALDGATIRHIAQARAAMPAWSSCGRRSMPDADEQPRCRGRRR